MYHSKNKQWLFNNGNKTMKKKNTYEPCALTVSVHSSIREKNEISFINLLVY